MASPSPTNSLSPTGATPIPYRLDTRAILVPPPIDTATLLLIRAQIQPRRGWWQVELRPWHYWTAIGSAAMTAAAFIALLVTTGSIR